MPDVYVVTVTNGYDATSPEHAATTLADAMLIGDALVTEPGASLRHARQCGTWQVAPEGDAALLPLDDRGYQWVEVAPVHLCSPDVAVSPPEPPHHVG